MSENNAITKIFAENHKKSRIYNEVYEWVGSFLFVLVIVIFIFSFIFREVSVDGNSMMNTLNNGDRLIIRSVCYKPKDNDIVVIYAKNLHKTIVKRVIAVGGQTVDIDYAAHRVYVDDVLRYEPFIKEPTAFMGVQPVMNMPAKVPANCAFVMGDNRNVSIDSRSGEVGMVSDSYILGKAVLRYSPPGKIEIFK